MSEIESTHLRVLKKQLENYKKTPKNMVYIPPYNFYNYKELKQSLSKTPIEKGYYIDLYEVSNLDYLRFIRKESYQDEYNLMGQYRKNRNIKDLPVANVRQIDAKNYAKWRGKRLPTEKEWEFAASWDPKTERYLKFPWGDRFSMKKCNVRSDDLKPVNSHAKGRSPWGLYHMTGNVTEWTSSQKISYRNYYQRL